MRQVIVTIARSGAIMLWSVVTLYFVSLLTLKLLGYHHTVVVSNSMSPLLEAGDLVLIQEKDSYGVGDIIQFERSGLLYIHRIVKETDQGFKTQGDANPVADLTLVQPDAIQGVALGVFSQLGDPLYVFNRLASSFAAFTSSKTISSNAHARFWQSPTMSWTIISGVGNITFTAPNGLTFLGSGTRTIQSSITSTSLVRIFVDARLTNRDSVSAGFLVSTHTCLNAQSKPICGWVIQVDDTNKQVVLRTYQSNGSLSSVLRTISYSTSLTSNRKYVLEISPTRIFVKLESTVLLDIKNPNVLASNNGALIPTGSRILFQMVGDNRINANRFIIW
jgi:signal peptidase I